MIWPVEQAKLQLNTASITCTPLESDERPIPLFLMVVLRD